VNKKISNKKISLKPTLFIIVIFLFLFLTIITAQAATSGRVRGAALWDNFGYLYFSCADDVMGDRLDDPYNLCGGNIGNALICGTGENVFHFFSEPCSGSTHQVYIANNGNLSGEAWNYYKGYVSFDATPANPLTDYSFASNCLSTCNSGNGCLACYNEDTQKVYGWARVVNDNSWINLSPATTSPTVQIKSWATASSTSPFYSSDNLKPGDFIGYATNGSSNISFNCLSADGGGGNSCSTYKVYLSNLQIGHLSAPNWSPENSCTAPARQAYLKWDLKSGCNDLIGACSPSGKDSQTAFEIIINTSNNTTSPVYSSGPVTGTLYRWLIDTSKFTNFAYNQSYYWWIRLKDNNNVWTQWYQFGAKDGGHNGLADNITDLGSVYTSPDAKTFTTYKHEFPTPSFTWAPAEVFVSATTTFTSTSQYDAAIGSTTWSTTDLGALISATNSPVTNIFFLQQSTARAVTLTISDVDLYTCSKTQNLAINYGLPIWREVKAE
jgi:hypothetical protein